jgi:MFS family permease
LGARFFSGPLADRRGRRIALLTGLVSCALAGIAYLLPMGIVGPYLARALQGVGEACLYTGAAAWVVELGGIHRSAQSLGYLSSAIWGGISCGPVIGHWLGSFERAALTQVIAAIVAFVVLTRIPEEYEPALHPRRRRWIPTSLIAPGITIGFVNVHYPVITGFLILHLAKHGDSGPAAFTLYALMILLSRFFLGGLPDRIHPSITFYCGIAGMAVGLSIIAMAPSPAIAIGAAALLGFGFSFPWASIASTVLKQTPANERGSAVGVLSAFYDLFVGISSFGAGAIANRFGYSAAFLMATASLVAAAVAARYVFSARDYGVGVTVEEECWETNS